MRVVWYNSVEVSNTGVPQGASVLEDLRARAQADVDRCQQALESAKNAHARSVERLSHIKALLDLEQEVLDGPSLATPNREPTAQRDRIGVPDSKAVDAAFSVIESRGTPMHYRDIYSEIERQGILIRGASPANTLLTRMLRDGRFRPAGARGFYEIDPNGGHRHFRRARGTTPGAA
jgi:HB1, ASXL, restriction endonuclease HTH domain